METNQIGRRSLRLLFAVFILMLMAMPLVGHGQTTSGTIVGTLTDTSGGVLPHTPVVLINVATNTKMQAESDGLGYYQFFNVPPAQYKLTVQKTGFRQLTSAAFRLEVEGSLRINLQMQVGAESETVTVTEQAPLIQAENTSLGTVIDQRETVELPLNGRNPMNLTALVPSVVPQGQSNGNTNATNPFAWGNYQIGGGMANQSATYVDGSPVNTAYLNLTALVPTQDSLAEFKVDTNNLTADYGHLAGGAVQFSTKSGTNQLHATAWEYIRNKVLDANDWFSNNNGTARGAFSQNQFGFNLGGPVFIPKVYNGHNRTFFFFNWEGFYLRQGATSTQTVPTADELAGNMTLLPKVKNSSNTYVEPTIYDPATTCLVATGCTDSEHGTNYGDRLPFAGNVIPNDRINQTAVNYIKHFYPVTAVGSDNTVGNWTGHYSVGGQNFETVAKIDHQFSEKNHLSSRFTYWKNTNLPQDPMGTGICQDRCGEDFKTYNWVLGDTHTFNSTTILDVRLSYQRFEYSRTAKNTTYTPSDIGQTLTTAPEFPGPMVVSISGFDTANTFGSAGADSTILGYTDNDRISGNLTKIWGKHTFKFGGEYLRMSFNYLQTNNSAGQAAVDTRYTVNNYNSSTTATGSGLATFLLGYVTSWTGYLTNDPVTAQLLYPAVYGTDDWRVTNKLTAHLGLRWENNLPWTDRFDDISYFDKNAINPILSGAGLTSYKGTVEVVNSSSRKSRRAQNTFNGQVSPRIGFTYQLTSNTVLSAGYGLLWIPIDVSFNSSPNNDPINSFETTGVTSTNGDISPADSNNFTNPLPGGIIAPPRRSSDATHGFQYVMLGKGNAYNFPDNGYGYAQQWNLGLQHQFGPTLVVDAAYAGAKGTHLPRYSLSQTALPESYFNSDSANLAFLSASVANPFVNIINSDYTMGAATTTNRVLVSPYPQYNGMSSTSDADADSSYHSLQVKLQKRFTGGASIGLGYTFAKLISSTDTLTGWLESSAADNWGVTDANRLYLEKSLSSNDVKHRLVVSYVYDVPMGKGKGFLGNANTVVNTVVGGWSLQGITTFQSGFPLPVSLETNSNTVFGYGQRPYATAGCDRTKKSSGAANKREWFNVSCYQHPEILNFGQSRNDPSARTPGIDNWDISIVKNFGFAHDKGKVQFRSEFFNTFNRTQFGVPNSDIDSGSAGLVTSQGNLPRLVQFALRIQY